MNRFVVLPVTGVLAAAFLSGCGAQQDQESPDRGSADPPAQVMGQWSMTAEGGTVPSMNGEEPMTLSGPWERVDGAVGDAVRFYSRETTYGIAHGTEPDNPDASDFAMGVTFTSEPLTAGVGFSGNVMQKGRAADDGQVKISTLPTQVGAAAFCRVEGTNGFEVLKSKVPVDDGEFHTAICWREGGTIGLTVDGVEARLDVDLGSIVTDEPMRIGNQASEGNWTDQHFGKNDCSVWVIGSGARQVADSLTPC